MSPAPTSRPHCEINPDWRALSPSNYTYTQKEGRCAMANHDDKLAPARAARHLMLPAKQSREETAALAAQVLSPSESAVTTLQSTIAAVAIELQRRVSEGSATHKDVALIGQLATAAAKLSAELREQASQSSLALNSDEDIVRLVCDSVRALPGNRGVAILRAALRQLQQPAEPAESE